MRLRARLGTATKDVSKKFSVPQMIENGITPFELPKCSRRHVKSIATVHKVELRGDNEGEIACIGYRVEYEEGGGAKP
ncbi:hypothetical protein MTO96_025468 [Rhipicephalus appendiculatus]